VVAYNKVDVPDSGDYYEDIRDALLGQGVGAADVLAVSAATGQGVTPLVRRLHALLDALPAQARPRAAAALCAAGRCHTALSAPLLACCATLWPWRGCGAAPGCSATARAQSRRSPRARRRPRT